MMQNSFVPSTWNIIPLTLKYAEWILKWKETLETLFNWNEVKVKKDVLQKIAEQNDKLFYF